MVTQSTRLDVSRLLSQQGHDVLHIYSHPSQSLIHDLVVRTLEDMPWDVSSNQYEHIYQETASEKAVSEMSAILTKKR